jgi:glutaryl-CoA dehydrogenase
MTEFYPSDQYGYSTLLSEEEPRSCAAKARETTALAREICGGTGIILDNRVGRFFADAEAVYSYESTHEIGSLIVGRALTGLGAFR